MVKAYAGLAHANAKSTHIEKKGVRTHRSGGRCDLALRLHPCPHGRRHQRGRAEGRAGQYLKKVCTGVRDCSRW